MIAGIHQHHYFPWMGYLDKMAKSDVFVLLDDVQLTDASFMFRHQMLDKNGEKKYITIPFHKQGYMQKPYRALEVNTAVDWQTRQKNFLWDSYRKHPYFSQVWERIGPVFEKPYERLAEVTEDSIAILRDIFEITTPLAYQSRLEIPDSRKSEFLLHILHQVGADVYLSGNGAKKYMDMQMFEDAGVRVIYQEFTLPVYPQKNSAAFVPGISSLDLLFNCGVEASRALFWENVRRGTERERAGQ